MKLSFNQVGRIDDNKSEEIYAGDIPSRIEDSNQRARAYEVRIFMLKAICGFAYVGHKDVIYRVTSNPNKNRC